MRPWFDMLIRSPPCTTIVPYANSFDPNETPTRRLTWIEAIWHSHICPNFEKHVSILKIEAEDNFSRRQFIWRAKGLYYHIVNDHVLFTSIRVQYWSLSNWQNFRFRCSCVAVLVNWTFVIILSSFRVFKNVVHSLEPVETPSTSPSHQAPNYVQRF